MKIDPGLPPPADPQRPTTADVGHGRPFEDFLGSEIAQDRAFGFAEFGMLGREGQGQGSAPNATPSKPPIDAFHAILPVESLDKPVDGPTTQPPANDDPGVEPAQRPMRVAATPEARAHAPIVRDAPADAGFAFPAPEPTSAAEDAPSTTAIARRNARARPARSDVCLTMIVKDGGVELVAAGPALDPQSCAMLRRLARGILARNGLELAQFHLNGVRLAADSINMIGGSHGTRTN